MALRKESSWDENARVGCGRNIRPRGFFADDPAGKLFLKNRSRMHRGWSSGMSLR